MTQHLHLFLGCIEAILGCLITFFVPKFAAVLLIPAIYVPTLQGLAACATITVCVYTISMDIRKRLKK